MSLIGKRVTEAEVRAVVIPEPTHSHIPIAHDRFLDLMEDSIDKLGVPIINREYSLAKEKQQLFGVWQVGNLTNGMSLALGFRNSHDKTLAAGIVAGTRVLVCDNLCFSGEFIALRRHTMNLMRDLPPMISEALEVGIEKGNEFVEWHKKLKEYETGKYEMKLLHYEAMEKRIVKPSTFVDVKETLEMYKEKEGENLYAFHGALTESLKDKPLATVHQRTSMLTIMLNAYIVTNFK